MNIIWILVMCLSMSGKRKKKQVRIELNIFLKGGSKKTLSLDSNKESRTISIKKMPPFPPLFKCLCKMLFM